MPDGNVEINHPTYIRLRTALIADLIVRGQEENEAAKAVYEHILDVLWPEIKGIIACGNLLAMDHTRTPASIKAWYILTDQEPPPDAYS